MLYRSVLHVKRKSFCDQEFFFDRYQWHRSLSKVFAPVGVPNAYRAFTLRQARVLFHLQPFVDRLQVVVQSKLRPEWSRFEDCRGGVLLEPAVLTWPSGRLKGRCLSFRLDARPSRPLYGKREMLVEPGAQLLWLSRQASRNGFEIRYASAVQAPFVLGERSNYRRQFWATSFRGELKVTSRDRFVQAVERGLGPNKAYGFGLLLTE